MKLKTCDNWIVLGLFLGMVGLISALLLAICARLTAEPIAKAQAQAFNKSLQQVLPAFDNDPASTTAETGDLVFYGAFKDGKLVGVCAKAQAKGYGATPVEGLVGFDPETGKITTVVITANQETPGLGSQLCERKLQKTVFNLLSAAENSLAPNHYLDQFSGKAAESDKAWKIQKDGGEFDFVTGATISSRAITDLAYLAASAYTAERENINRKLIAR